MATGLVALLDDVAAIAKIAAASIDDVAAGAAKASSKTLGVIIDDTAVAPQYVDGLKPNREIPIVWRIAIGSIRNKVFIVIPVAILLSIVLPKALPVLLILGGSYLSFEGAEKIIEKLFHKKQHDSPAVLRGPKAEDHVVANATRTDLILSAEIMVIALNEVLDQSLWMRIVILLITAVLITALVYGVVALIIKADDFGLHLTATGTECGIRWGNFILKAMPKIMMFLTIIGTAAMLWVGGHLIIIQTTELGFTTPYDVIHRVTEPIHRIAGLGSPLAWTTETLISLIFGLLWGTLIVGVVHIIPFGHRSSEDQNEPNVSTSFTSRSSAVHDADPTTPSSGNSAGNETN